MVLSDPIANFLTSVRNGQIRMLKVVSVSNSSMIRSILHILLSEGYVESFIEKKDNYSKLDFPSLIEIRLKYSSIKSPVIKEIVRVSKPGCRVYFSSKEIPKFYNGLGVYILSTSQGVMSDFQARKLGIGGELLCGVF